MDYFSTSWYPTTQTKLNEITLKQRAVLKKSPPLHKNTQTFGNHGDWLKEKIYQMSHGSYVLRIDHLR